MRALLCGLISACSEATPPPVASPDGTGTIESFLDHHWLRPLAPQGIAPEGFSPEEASLDPDACGGCHVQQHADWRTSLHARAMGPGVLGQLLDMAPDAVDEHQGCIRCHAPLAEQAGSLSEAIAQPLAGSPKALTHELGLTCAACHVRGHRRFGPPRRDGSERGSGDAALPHHGWKASTAFEDSRFCSACHQFQVGEFALNGKLLENTYEEWKASRYAREGKSCQSCHMPDRRHLWRGVHDESMMKSAVAISAAAPVNTGDSVEASLSIRNTGTGHYFPTYVTPKVIAEIYQATADGKILPDTLQVHVIARLVELDLSREIADTRLAPDEEAVLRYRRPVHRRAGLLVYRVRVEPDAFYQGFFESSLASGQPVRGKPMIRTALEHSKRSRFTIFEEQRPLRRASPAK